MAESTKHPSHYSVVVFFKDVTRHPIRFPFVASIYYIHKYLGGRNQKGVYYDYWYMNIYHRKTGRYLGRQYFDQHVVDKPHF